ncbi:outer membrane protein BabB [Helicobacter pylori NQ4110]|nr:outer membrane protein BabB [Helicobacter pylori NQ4110]
MPNAKSLQNMTHATQNPNSPEGLLTYSLNADKYSQLQTTAQELGKNPFRRFGMISSQTNNGAMNGIGVQVGYKQFFGKKRNWGLRYYGFFDYNHAYIKSNFLTPLLMCGLMGWEWMHFITSLTIKTPTF